MDSPAENTYALIKKKKKDLMETNKWIILWVQMN